MSGLEVLIEWLEENPDQNVIDILQKAVEINQLEKMHMNMPENIEHRSGWYDYPFTVNDFNYYTNCTR